MLGRLQAASCRRPSRSGGTAAKVASRPTATSREGVRQQQRARHAAALRASQAQAEGWQQAAEQRAQARRADAQERRSMWAQYRRQWQRWYSCDADADDCWGVPCTADHPRQQQEQGQPPSAEQWWKQFCSETSAGGYQYFNGTQQHQQQHQQQTQQQQQQQHQQQQAHAEAEQQQQPPLVQPPLPDSEEEEAVVAEAQARLELLLRQSGGDLLVFVQALGVRVAPAADRGGAVRAARRAALLRWHPDRLQAAASREEQLFGLAASRLLNELWLQERAQQL